MTTLLSNTVQPPLLTLLSSTSDPALSPLFTTQVEATNPNDSFITVLPDHLTRPYPESGPSNAISKTKRRTFDQNFVQSQAGYADVVGHVIHIQSPKPHRTYIQAGCRKGKGKARERVEDGNSNVPLGIELPWVGLQIKRLGQRGMALEFGMTDERGREGVIRLSSYKSKATSHPDRTPPLVHLPLDLPSIDKHTLTSWLDIKLNLANLMPLFKTLPRSNADGDGESSRGKKSRLDTAAGTGIPNDQFGHVTYVRVYANCRLRRIWFSANGEQTLEQAGVKDEWALFARDTPVS